MDELRIFLLVPAGFAVLGTVFAWFGVRSIRAVSSFKRRAVRVPGRCVGMESRVSYGGDGAPTRIYYPVVAFALPDGRTIETTVESGASPPPAREGRDCTVLYLPDEPTRARVEGFIADGTFVYTMMIVLGGLFAVVGTAVLAIALAFTA